MARRKTPKRRQYAHQAPLRTLTWLFVPLVAAGCLLFLSYADYQQKQEAKRLVSAQEAFAKDLDSRVAAAVKKKIELAKKAEAEAKAKQEAELAKIKAGQSLASRTDPTGCGVSNPTSYSVVINKKHCFKPLEWAPGDLTSVGGYPLRQEAASQMIAMMNAAATAGNGFELSSAYRSYANQQVTYNYWVSVNGSSAAADTVSARPGYSEHQTGLAADLKVGSCSLECFSGTGAYSWMTANAANYGYILRYPNGLTGITGYSPEAWHWRYVGVSTAKDMKTKGIQTLEQYFGVSGGDYN